MAGGMRRPWISRCSLSRIALSIEPSCAVNRANALDSSDGGAESYWPQKSGLKDADSPEESAGSQSQLAGGIAYPCFDSKWESLRKCLVSLLRFSARGTIIGPVIGRSPMTAAAADSPYASGSRNISEFHLESILLTPDCTAFPQIEERGWSLHWRSSRAYPRWS